MPALYELTNAMRAACARLDETEADGELPPDLAYDFDRLEMEFGEKVEAILKFRVGLTAEVEGIDTEIKRLTAMRDTVQRKADWLKGYVFREMQRSGATRVDGKLFKVWVQKNSRPSFTLEVGADIPAAYSKTTVSLDTQALYEAWKAGRTLPATVEVNEGSHLRIR